MAIKITEDCINCGACEAECPNNAIYEPDILWKMSDGTNVKDDIERSDGGFSDEFYYIATDKCTECKGFFDEPQCAAVCPVDCCVDDEDNIETDEELLSKQKKLHDD
jgi:ferredoxin